MEHFSLQKTRSESFETESLLYDSTYNDHVTVLELILLVSELN